MLFPYYSKTTGNWISPILKCIIFSSRTIAVEFDIIISFPSPEKGRNIARSPSWPWGNVWTDLPANSHHFSIISTQLNSIIRHANQQQISARCRQVADFGRFGIDFMPQPGQQNHQFTRQTAVGQRYFWLFSPFFCFKFDSFEGWFSKVCHGWCEVVSITSDSNGEIRLQFGKIVWLSYNCCLRNLSDFPAWWSSD